MSLHLSLCPTPPQVGQGSKHLFFGNRNRNQDFLFQDQLEQLQDEGTLTNLHVAFSRDQADKVYVQHRLRENPSVVMDAIDNGGYVFVCGDGEHMARDVHSTLIDIVASTRGCDSDEAEDALSDLMARQRYVRDIWS